MGRPSRSFAWTAAALTALALAAPRPARADVKPSGAVTGHLIFADQAWGGALSADITAPFGALRLGGALAVAALTSDDDARSRVAMPVGLSAALVVPTGSRLWLDLRARAGI
jgi:hypothetical protein